MELSAYVDKYFTPYYTSATTYLQPKLNSLHETAATLASTTSPYRDQLNEVIKANIPEDLIEQITSVVFCTEVTGILGGFLATAGVKDSKLIRLAGFGAIAHTFLKTTTNEEATRAIESIALGLFVGLSWTFVKCCCCCSSRNTRKIDLDVVINTKAVYANIESDPVTSSVTTDSPNKPKKRKNRQKSTTSSVPGGDT